MEIPGFVEEWEKAGKEGTKMKLIWNELLHANFRCCLLYTSDAADD